MTGEVGQATYRPQLAQLEALSVALRRAVVIFVPVVLVKRLVGVRDARARQRPHLKPSVLASDEVGRALKRHVRAAGDSVVFGGAVVHVVAQHAVLEVYRQRDAGRELIDGVFPERVDGAARRRARAAALGRGVVVELALVAGEGELLLFGGQEGRSGRVGLVSWRRGE